jgi:tetratricopeptide (TPR) repeat protein
MLPRLEVGRRQPTEEDGMRAQRIGLTIALMTILTAAPVLADQAADFETRAVADPERAAQLKERAEELYTQPKQWKKAARLLAQSAALREASDPEVYECLISAGRIQAAIGEFGAARESIEKAAEHAMARGAIVEAANAYIDAAHLSVELKDAARARDLVDRARLLTESPLLSLQQRTVLIRRISA